MIQKPIKYQTIADLCRALGWARSTVDYNIWMSQTIPPPRHIKGRGRRCYYTEDEVRQIVAMVREMKT